MKTVSKKNPNFRADLKCQNTQKPLGLRYRRFEVLLIEDMWLFSTFWLPLSIFNAHQNKVH